MLASRITVTIFFRVGGRVVRGHSSGGTCGIITFEEPFWDRMMMTFEVSLEGKTPKKRVSVMSMLTHLEGRNEWVFY